MPIHDKGESLDAPRGPCTLGRGWCGIPAPRGAAKNAASRRLVTAAMSSDAQLPHRVQATVLSQTFWVDPAYSITKGLGQGAYGCVASAVHRASGESISIKRISNVFTKRILTKRALREIK